jgi:hypothetical protein
LVVEFCLGVTALLKVSFYGCPPTPDLHSPSGHTSLSALVYGAMALVTASEAGDARRIMEVEHKRLPKFALRVDQRQSYPTYSIEGKPDN